MVHQIRPDLWVVVDNDHTTKYHMKWLPANGTITENVHGVTGWARFTEAVVDGIDGLGPLPNIQRVHLCFAVPCPSRWCNSRYDILAHKRPWLHVRQVDAPGTELPTAAVGSHAGRPSSGTASAAVLFDRAGAVWPVGCQWCICSMDPFEARQHGPLFFTYERR